MWWGQTSALDLCSETSEGDVNALLIGQSDCRHVLQTLARKYRHTDRRLKLYVYEPQLENIGKSLLLLSLGLDGNLGLGRKSQIFLDVYGNTLIRPSTWQYLNEAANRLVKIITNFNYAELVLPPVSLDCLKYKDRDRLEHIFKFWSVGADDFDILRFWDNRIRAHLGTRYDSRLGVYDWDLHMRYRAYGAEVIGTQEYKTFREKGIAFIQDDTDPCIPNVTLASFQNNSKKPLSGYFGDIVTGPYPAFGLDCENKDMLKKYNGQLRKTATDISLFNVQQMFHEIEKNSAYDPPKEDFDSVTREDVTEQLKARKNDWRRPSEDSYSSIPVYDVEIIFLPITAMKDYPEKPQFQKFFDIITIPQNLVNQLPPTWKNFPKPGAKVLVESNRYLLSCGRDALAKDKTSLDDFMKNAGCEIVEPFDYKKDDFVRYVVD